MGKRVYLEGPETAFLNYRKTLARLGGEVVSIGDPLECDALLLPGGGDPDPMLYGESPKGAEPPDRERDALELSLLAQFTAAGKPILGICRGMQMLNLFFGGTLIQDLAGHRQREGRDQTHSVCTVPGSHLYGLYGSEMRVNSAHHQAVSRPGKGLNIAQRASDGVIEAVEHETLPIVGVQWHPERLGGEGEILLSAFLDI